MTIPTSKVLSVSKGMMALTDLKHCSPSQSVTVNVSTCERKPDNPPTEIKADYSETEPNPYINIQNRNIDSANATQEELQKIIKAKDGICSALLLMLDIIENNPLVIKNFIVAESASLQKLIQLLTGGNEVTIQSDFDVGCSCGSTSYLKVDKIFVKKDGETYNFKYSFPDSLKILDDHHISTKLVC